MSDSTARVGVSKWGIAGFIASVLGVIAFSAPALALVLGALGVVFGILGMLEKGRQGHGLAIAAVIIGGVAIIAGVVVLVARIAVA